MGEDILEAEETLELAARVNQKYNEYVGTVEVSEDG